MFKLCQHSSISWDSFEIASIWFFHVRFLSMITPKNLVELTLFKDTPSSLILRFSFSKSLELVDTDSFNTLMSWFISMNFLVLWWVPSTMLFVLPALTDNLLAWNQLHISCSSLLIYSFWDVISGWENNKVVSSANRISSSKEVVFTISLIYNMNNNGPRIDPWGTPQLIILWSESCIW